MVAAQNDKFDGELFDAYQMCIVLNCSYGCGCCWCVCVCVASYGGELLLDSSSP